MNHQTKKDVNGKYRGCLLKEMEGDSDSEIPEYSLPPKSIVKRPRKSVKKRSRSSWRKYCRKCCRYCSNVVLVLVITACLLSISLLFWFTIRLYRDVENLSRRLTIQINQVQAEQADNIEKFNSLKLTVKGHVQKNDLLQKDVVNLKKKLGLSLSKIGLVNSTLAKMSHQLHDANNKVMLKTKVDALQKGMAETGAEITKLSDQVKQIEKQTTLQLSAIRKINSGLLNISYELANTTGKSGNPFNDLNHVLDPFNDVNKNRESGKPQHLRKNSLLIGQTSSNAVEMLNAVNQSLTSELLKLQSETQALKGDISGSVYKMKRDLFSTQQLLINVSLRVHNLTELSQEKKSKQINTNSKEIRSLWDELEEQNFTLLALQRRIDMISENGPGVPRDAERTEDSERLDLLSEPRDESGTEKGRNLRVSEYKSRPRKSNIGRRHLDEFNDYLDT